MKFEHLETKRLQLRGLSPEDMDYIFEQVAKEEAKKILGHRSEDDYLKEKRKQQDGYASYNRRFVLFLLVDKESGRVIGRCGIHNWNKEHRRAELGYRMEDERFKRKGLMSEAVRAVIDYGFRRLDLNRLDALVGVGNVPSLRLMEKNGFVREGVLRQHMLVGGAFVDSVLFSKLREEYAREQGA